MRLLAVVTLGLFCVLLIILFRSPTTVNQPSRENVKLETWERDPNLDRMDVDFLYGHQTDNHSDWGTTRTPSSR